MDVRISEYPAIVTPSFTDIREVVQGGVNYKETDAQLRNLFFGSQEEWEEQIACGNISRGWSFEDHFNGNSLTNWALTQSGGGEYPVTTQADSGLDYLGEARFRLSTNAGYFNAFAMGSVPHGNFYGLGKMVITYRFFLPVFGGGNAGKYQFGLLGTSVAADADQVNGLYLEYDNDSSANWRYCGAKASSRSKTSSSLAVATGIHTGQIIINAAWTSVEFRVDGTSLGTIADSYYIPTAGVGIGLCGYKRTLTATYTGFIDLVKAWQLYNTPLVF